MGYTCLLFACLFCFIQQNEGKQAWHVVPEHAPKEIDLTSPFDSSTAHSRAVFNDERKGITAIHDSRNDACYLTKYDPEWDLNEEERDTISRTSVAQVLRSPIEHLQFRVKVGEIISAVCRRKRLYWMTQPKTPPKPQGHHHPPEPLAPVKPLVHGHNIEHHSHSLHSEVQSPPKPHGHSQMHGPPPMPHGHVAHHRAPEQPEDEYPVPEAEKYIIPPKRHHH